MVGPAGRRPAAAPRPLTWCKSRRPGAWRRPAEAVSLSVRPLPLRSADASRPLTRNNAAMALSRGSSRVPPPSGRFQLLCAVRRGLPTTARVRPKDDLACEPSGFQATMSIDDRFKPDFLSDTGLDRPGGEQPQKLLQILPEPLRMGSAHCIDGIETRAFSSREKSPEIQARNCHQDGEHPPFVLHLRRIADGDQQPAPAQRVE